MAFSRIPRAARAAVILGGFVATAAALPAPQNPWIARDASPDRESEPPALPPLERVLPADTFAWVGVDHLTDFQAAFAASPTERMFADEAFAPLCTEVSRRVGLLRSYAATALGTDPIRLLELFEGPVSLSVSIPGGASGAAIDDETDMPAMVLLLADVGGHRAEAETVVAELLKRVHQLDERLTLATAHVGGVSFTTLTQWARALPPAQIEAQVLRGPEVDVHESGTRGGKSGAQPTQSTQEVEAARVAEGVLSCGFRGSLLIVAFTWHAGPEPLARVLAGLDGRPAGPVLGDAPAFRASLAARAGGIRGYADIGAFARLMIAREGYGSPDEAAGNEAVVRELGLLDLGAASQRFDCGTAGSEWSLGLDWPGEGFIPRMLRMLCQPGGARTLACVPADCRSAAVLHMNPAGMFDATIKLLLDMKWVEPADVVEHLSAAEEKLGCSPRDDILEMLDGEMALVTCATDEEDAFPGTEVDPQNFAAIFGLTDGAAFEATLEQVLRNFGFHAARVRQDYEGVAVSRYTVFHPFSVSWAVHGDMLVVSPSGALVRAVLRQQLHPELPDLAEVPEFKSAVARLPGQWGMLCYNDTAASMEGGLKALSMLPEIIGNATAGMPPEVRRELNMQDWIYWISDLPVPEPGIAGRYLSGPTLTTLTVDGQGVRLLSVGP
jgi:hypothetical protein